MSEQLPPEVVPNARNLVEGATFRTLFALAEKRIPAHPTVQAPAQEAIAQSFLRQGYELALSTILAIPYEESLTPDATHPLLDPRD